MNVLPNWTWTWFHWELGKIKPQSKDFSEQMWKLGLAAAFVFAHHQYISNKQKNIKMIKNREEFSQSRIERFDFLRKPSEEEQEEEHDFDDGRKELDDESIISTMDNSVASSVMYVNELRLKQGKSIPPIPPNSTTFSPFVNQTPMHRSVDAPISARSQHVMKDQSFYSSFMEDEYNYDDYIRDNVEVDELPAQPSEDQMVATTPQKPSSYPPKSSISPEFVPYFDMTAEHVLPVADEAVQYESEEELQHGQWNEAERLELYQRIEELMHLIQEKDLHIHELYDLLLHVTQDFELSKSLEDALLKMGLPVFLSPQKKKRSSMKPSDYPMNDETYFMPLQAAGKNEEEFSFANPLASRKSEAPGSTADTITTTESINDQSEAIIKELQAKLAKQLQITEELQEHCDVLYTEKQQLQGQVIQLQQQCNENEEKILQQTKAYDDQLRKEIVHVQQLSSLVEKNLQSIKAAVGPATESKQTEEQEEASESMLLNTTNVRDIIPTPYKSPTGGALISPIPKNTEEKVGLEGLDSPLPRESLLSPTTTVATMTTASRSSSNVSSPLFLVSYNELHSLLHDQLTPQLYVLQQYISKFQEQHQQLQITSQEKSVQLVELRNSLNTLRLTKVQEIVDLHRTMMAMQSTNKEKESFYLNQIQQLLSTNTPPPTMTASVFSTTATSNETEITAAHSGVRSRSNSRSGTTARRSGTPSAISPNTSGKMLAPPPLIPSPSTLSTANLSSASAATASTNLFPNTPNIYPTPSFTAPTTNMSENGIVTPNNAVNDSATKRSNSANRIRRLLNLTSPSNTSNVTASTILTPIFSPTPSVDPTALKSVISPTDQVITVGGSATNSVSVPATSPTSFRKKTSPVSVVASFQREKDFETATQESSNPETSRSNSLSSFDSSGIIGDIIPKKSTALPQINNIVTVPSAAANETEEEEEEEDAYQYYPEKNTTVSMKDIFPAPISTAATGSSTRSAGKSTNTSASDDTQQKLQQRMRIFANPSSLSARSGGRGYGNVNATGNGRSSKTLNEKKPSSGNSASAAYWTTSIPDDTTDATTV